MPARVSVFSLLLAATLIACGDDGGPSEPTYKVTKVIVHGFDTLYSGATQPFTAEIIYDGAAPAASPRVEWSSSSPENISVDSIGNVTAITPMITAVDGEVPIGIQARVGKVGGTLAVHVVASPPFIVFPSPAVVALGDTKQLVAYTQRSYYFRNKVTPQSWSSDQPAIATVDGSGVISALSAGTAAITANYSAYGRMFSIQGSVTVVPPQNLKFTAVTGGPFSEDEMSSGIYARFDRNCGIAAGGAMYCWGLLAPGFTPYDACDVTFSQTHYVTSQCSSLPTKIPVNDTFISVSAGDAGGGCALTAGGAVYCFGLNNAAQLGIAATLDTSGSGFVSSREIGVHRFLDHATTRLPSSEPFRGVFAASNQRCAIQRNDIAVCWGSLLGDKPAQLSTFGWNTIAARGGCGIIADSSAFCWNVSGGKPSLYSIPLPYHLTHIEVSHASTCALASTGEVACWRAAGTPVVVANNPGLVSLGIMPSTAGYRTMVCGLTAAGDAYCVLPASFTGQNTTYSFQSIDLGVKLKSFSYNCGIGVDDKAYCWKWNSLKAVVVPGQ
jgi:hypothetical protein